MSMPAYYANTVREFLSSASRDLESQLVAAYERDRYNELKVAQLTAWRDQIQILEAALSTYELVSFGADDWGIALEFVIPRRMGRMDTVLLIGDAIVGIEFKTELVDSGAADQVEDYCLDLLHFHEPSHGRSIYPVVVGAHPGSMRGKKLRLARQLQPTTALARNNLGEFIGSVAGRHATAAQIPIQTWNMGEYHPVPSIVEAARAMFAQMQVEDIAKADCDPINLTATVSTIRDIAVSSMAEKRKTVCFVTGVPGAGKTLAGLKLVHDRDLQKATSTDSVFLTGNLPLVKVLRAALAKDVARRKKQASRISGRDPKTTIDTVLGYKKTHTKTSKPPHENIVVFDEAQRAWNAERTEEYLDGTDTWKGYSEPELLMAILDRHDWAVLIALVGGGQEINRGEAGIGEWGRALLSRFKHWDIAASQQALDGAYGAGAKLFESDIPADAKVAMYPTLHLDNPTRQFRGKTIARWVESLLEGDCDECRHVLHGNPDYPIYLTRDLQQAKEWLRAAASGTERYGCIASSESKRLRAEGLELPPARADGVEHWFLSPEGDVRSSFQLEVAANEFQIQGLEIDWACLCWGGDFLRERQQWVLRRFRGTQWQNIGQPEARAYLINSYRVLLTRARQGMILFVPRGDDEDLTRSSGPLDATAEFLNACGAKYLD